MPRIPLTLAVLPLALLAACSSSTQHARTHLDHPDASCAVRPATDAQRAALLDRVKSLAGTWEMADAQGNRNPAVVYAVTSSGSAVREIMFPGSEHEMTNMYHMDGDSLVVTHYCAMGNQPRMRARLAEGGGAKDRIDFAFDSVTNMTAPDQPAMASLSLVWIDPDHIRQEWRSWGGGKSGEHATFDLYRRKG
jgi:hypothetical protein